MISSDILYACVCNVTPWQPQSKVYHKLISSIKTKDKNHYKKVPGILFSMAYMPVTNYITSVNQMNSIRNKSLGFLTSMAYNNYIDYS